MTKPPFEIALDRSSRVPLSEQFADGIRHAVRKGVCRRGDRLPTIHEWVRLLGVSEWVPRKALARLAEERLISVKKHVGAVVLGAEDRTPKGHVLYVSIDDGSVYSRNVMSFWLGYALANAGCRYRHVSVPSESCGGDDFAQLKDALWDGVDFVVYDGIRRREEITPLLAERGIPYLVIGDAARCVGRDVVTTAGNSADIMDEIISLLVGSGVRRVIQAGYGLWLGDALTSKLHARGLLAERLKIPPVRGGGTVESFQRAAMEEFLRRLAQGRKWLPDVFVFSDDMVATGALLALSVRGVRVPEDVRVITMSNKGYGPIYAKSLTRYERDNRANGLVLARYVLARLAGRRPKAPVFTVKFVRGKTF